MACLNGNGNSKGKGNEDIAVKLNLCIELLFKDVEAIIGIVAYNQLAIGNRQ